MSFRGRGQEFNGKSDAGKPQVRFDEQGLGTDLRHSERAADRGKKNARDSKGIAPALNPHTDLLAQIWVQLGTSCSWFSEPGRSA